MIKVSYATMEAMGMLVKRLGQDARRLEKALAETMNASAEWKRIAEELKKERNALRAATIDTAAGSLLDAFGSLANEPRNGSPDDKYHVRIVTKIHAIKLDRDALRKERDELATRLRQSIARGDFAEMRLATLAAELETERERHRQTAAVPQSVDGPRSHPVKVGEYLRRLTGFNTTPAGEIAQVIRVHVGTESNSYEYEVLRPNGQPGAWASKNCAPCDPPASHDTPAGKLTAQAAVTPQPGDVVRLVRVPTQEAWKEKFGVAGSTGRVAALFAGYVCVKYNGDTWEWPLSCVEVVKGGDK